MSPGRRRHDSHPRLKSAQPGRGAAHTLGAIGIADAQVAVERYAQAVDDRGLDAALEQHVVDSCCLNRYQPVIWSANCSFN